jgi:hypothetical protein
VLFFVGLVQEAHTLVTSFEWLLARAALGDPSSLVADIENVNEKQPNPTTKLVASALRLALGALHEDWRFLPAQLVGRLLGHVAVNEVYALLQQVCRWQGPPEGWFLLLCELVRNSLGVFQLEIIMINFLGNLKKPEHF